MGLNIGITVTGILAGRPLNDPPDLGRLSDTFETDLEHWMDKHAPVAGYGVSWVGVTSLVKVPGYSTNIHRIELDASLRLFGYGSQLYDNGGEFTQLHTVLFSWAMERFFDPDYGLDARCWWSW